MEHDKFCTFRRVQFGAGAVSDDPNVVLPMVTPYVEARPCICDSLREARADEANLIMQERKPNATH